MVQQADFFGDGASYITARALAEATYQELDVAEKSSSDAVPPSARVPHPNDVRIEAFSREQLRTHRLPISEMHFGIVGGLTAVLLAFLLMICCQLRRFGRRETRDVLTGKELNEPPSDWLSSQL